MAPHCIAYFVHSRPDKEGKKEEKVDEKKEKEKRKHRRREAEEIEDGEWEEVKGGVPVAAVSIYVRRFPKTNVSFSGFYLISGILP